MFRFTYLLFSIAILYPTNQSFVRKVEGNFSETLASPYFVDKTMFIKYFMSKPQHLLVLAPRGFGKSTNLSMLKLFLELQVDRNGTIVSPDPERSKFFERVKIRHEEDFYARNFAQHPVIDLNLKHLVCHASYLVFGRSFRDMIVRMLVKHKYLLRSKNLMLKAPQEFYNSFRLLFQTDFDPETAILMGRRMARFLATHFERRCIVLIDGFDAPGTTTLQPGCFHPGMMGVSTDKRILDIIGRFLTALLEGADEFVSHSLSTGISRVGATIVYANLSYVSALETPDLAQFFGLTESQVRDVAMRNGKLDCVENLGRWYGGYRVEGALQKQFNTRSIEGALKKGRYDRLWETPPVLEQLRYLFDYDQFGAALEKAFCSELPTQIIKSQLRVNALRFRGLFAKNYKYKPADNDLMIQFLLENGYFTASNVSATVINSVSVPNLEMQEALEEILYNEKFFRKKLDIGGSVVENYVSALVNLTGSEDDFRALLNSTARIFERTKPQTESDFQAPLFKFPNLVSGAFREVLTEYTSDRRRRDVTLTRKDGACVILAATLSQGSSLETLKLLLAYNHRKLTESRVVTATPPPPTGDLRGQQVTTPQSVLEALKEKARLYKKTKGGSQTAGSILVGLNLSEEGKYSLSYLCDSTNISAAKTLHL